MTKKKQTKKSAKQAAKKPPSRPGVAPTLQEIPAVKLQDIAMDAHALSAPEPLVTAPVEPDLAAESAAPTPLVVAVTTEVTPETSKTSEAAVVPDPSVVADPAFVDQPSVAEPSMISEPAGIAETVVIAEPALVAAPTGTAEPIPPVPSAPVKSVASEPAAAPELVTSSEPAPATISPSITNDIPMPATLEAAATAALEQSAGSNKTIYDIDALATAPTTASMPDAAAPVTTAPTPLTSPALNPQSLGSLTRSKSSSEVSRALPGKEDASPKWRPPVDYFGASASAFSSSFSGNASRGPNALKTPTDVHQTPNAANAAPGTLASSTPASSTPTSLTPASSTPTSSTPTSLTPASSTPASSIPPSSQIPSTPASSTPGSSTPVPQTPEVPIVYEPATDTSSLSPKMAKFVSSLRERELTASGASSPVLPQLESTSVEITPLPTTQPAQPSVTPPKITPVISAKAAEPKPTPAAAPVAPDMAMAETSRDLAPVAKAPFHDDATQEPKAFNEEKALAPKSSSQVAELRESIISQRADGKSEDWHPVAQKKPPRTADPKFISDLKELKKPDSGKQKSEADRHLSLEEMAAMEDLELLPQTQQQQSIRRLKSRTTGGIHAEIYIPIYILCLGLAWVTEQSAASGTCRDAGQRIDSALQLIAPKPLADNFVAGMNIYEDREIKLHPFNPSKPRNGFQILLSRILAFCHGVSSAFGRIPTAIAASAATNPLAEIMIILSYASIFIMSLLIFLKFKRSTTWTVPDFILLPIGLVAASTTITAVLIAVLSMSLSLAASYLPNTIILYTTVAVVLAVLDMARRSFFGRKQAIVRD